MSRKPWYIFKIASNKGVPLAVSKYLIFKDESILGGAWLPAGWENRM